MGRLYGFYKSKYSHIIGFQPTGWAFGKTINKITKRKSGPFTVYGVPYRSTCPRICLICSEHSNYDELREFVAWIKPDILIPTVDCNTPEKVKVFSNFQKLTPIGNSFSL